VLRKGHDPLSIVTIKDEGRGTNPQQTSSLELLRIKSSEETNCSGAQNKKKEKKCHLVH